MKKFFYIANRAILFYALFILMSGCKYNTVNVSKERDHLRDLQVKDKEPKIFDGELEPRMPDDNENDKTVEGIDANKNGIRDDVEIYINRRFDDPDYRRAFKQLAKSLQGWLLVADQSPKEVVRQMDDEYSRAFVCLAGLFGFSSDETKRKYGLVDDIHSMQIGSSSLRREVNTKAWNKMTGQSNTAFSGSYLDACYFKHERKYDRTK